MQHNLMKEKLNDLNNQLRIMILQNVREEEEYDDRFLRNMNRITKQIIDLRLSISKEKVNRNKVNSKFTSPYSVQY